MKLNFDPQISTLLQGAIDLHIHSAPDVYPRILDDIELARQAQAHGMRAIVIKNHFAPTAGRARIASGETGFHVLGGVVLNHPVGGLNRYAVEYALQMGGKIVWLPTFHAQYFLEKKNRLPHQKRQPDQDLQGLQVLNQDGTLKEELYRIFELLVRYDAVLATGHISFQEARTVVREASRCGVNKIVVTHPLASFVNYSPEEVKEILDLGATYLEHVYNDTTRHATHPIKVKDLFDCIKTVGPERCIMSTDAGQWVNPVPVQQMAIYMQEMLNLGISEQEIRRMTCENPAHVLGLATEG